MSFCFSEFGSTKTMSDTYKVIKSESRGQYKEKGSKFIAIALPVNTEEEIKFKLEEIKKEFHDARHHCFAYILGLGKETFRINDDGEPSGTAGRPIYNQILSKEITDVLVVVVRYFGGTKLGASGLVNAYKTAAREALDQARILAKTINDYYRVEYEYEDTNDIMRIVNDENLQQIQQDFEMNCKMVFAVRKNDSNRVFNRIKKNNKLSINYLKTE